MKENGKILTTLLIVFFILAIVIGAVCLGINMSNNEDAKETLANIVKKELTIEDFKRALSENGLIITKETRKAGEMIGAEEGYGYEINGVSIEIYKFDLESTDKLTVNNIKMLKSESKVVMPDFNNIELEAIYNEGLALMNYKEHPNQSKILNIFNNL